MIIHFKSYKHSGGATIVSILGGAMICMGISCAVIIPIDFIQNGLGEDGVEGVFGLIFVVAFFIGMGFFLQKKADNMNEKKIYKLWLEDIRSKNLEPMIATNLQIAVKAYSDAPTKKCEEHVLNLNPQLRPYLLMQLQKQQQNTAGQSAPANVPVQQPAKAMPSNISSQPPVQQAGSFCIKCGSRVIANSKFCTNCGAKIQC